MDTRDIYATIASVLSTDTPRSHSMTRKRTEFNPIGPACTVGAPFGDYPAQGIQNIGELRKHGQYRSFICRGAAMDPDNYMEGPHWHVEMPFVFQGTTQVPGVGTVILLRVDGDGEKGPMLPWMLGIGTDPEGRRSHYARTVAAR